jgi:enterochelin esterase-like enzyme
MRSLIAPILLATSLLACGAHAQAVQTLLTRIEAAPTEGRAAIVDSFLAAIPGGPLTEQDTLATFLYRGAVSSVNVPGDHNNWNPDGLPMSRLSTTDLFYVTVHFPREARLDYKYRLNGSTWILDPRNTLQVLGGFGPNSELRMPGYVPPPDIVYAPSIPHGRLIDTTFASTNLGNSRTVRVYLPPGYDTSTDSLGMILFHDGLEYISLAYAQNTIDYLIDLKRIRPIIAVFVPPVNRTQEYYSTQRTAFTAFVIQELMPWIDGRFRTRRSAEHRATLGASYGGHIAISLGLSHPEVFGNIAGQSSVIPSEGSGIAAGLPLKFYLDMGTFESGLIEGCRGFVGILQNRGYNILYREYPEAHSWGSWRAHIDNALEFFFPGEALGADHGAVLPSLPGLDQNFPNPFNPSSRIRFRVAAEGNVNLTVYDLLGREVAVLVDEGMARGSYEVSFDARGAQRHREGESTGLSSGVYLCRLRADGQAVTRKMLLLQ